MATTHGTSTTTVRVSLGTRETLNQVAAATGRSVDVIIAAGLRALRREQKRKEWEAEARLAGNDLEDRAEVAAALAELRGDDGDDVVTHTTTVGL